MPTSLDIEKSRLPSAELVKAYYDQRVAGKLDDFIHANPRIEAAIACIEAWAPAAPRNVLEIGCGVGATAWRMARAWPSATVLGVDISDTSIEVAQACFQLPNLRYQAGVSLGPDKYDLIVLMDVYEHILPSDRPELHTLIRHALCDESRVVMTVPTPDCQSRARSHNPAALQPVDEDIGLAEIAGFAAGTGTDVLYLRRLGIWHYGDYMHAVFGRFRRLDEVFRGCKRGWRLQEFLRRLRTSVAKLMLGSSPEDSYFGPRIGVAPFRGGRMSVSAKERRAAAARWQSGSRPRR